MNKDVINDIINDSEIGKVLNMLKFIPGLNTFKSVDFVQMLQVYITNMSDESLEKIKAIAKYLVGSDH
ncbi:MAG: hypothetical protein QXF82_00835 [Nitrososphaeria archaeon]